MSDSLPILRTHDHLVAVDKPAGLPSTGRDLEDSHCVQARLEAQLGCRVWAVHQLDADTTGVNLFVLRKSAVQVWQQALKQGSKRYLAFVHGKPDFRSERIEAAIDWVPAQRRRWVTKGGKAACTRVEVLSSAPRFALVQAIPETGRTHQLRIHLAWRGHPLVGEQRYRRKPCTRHPRQALHAETIRLPEIGAIRSPVPEDLRRLAEELRLDGGLAKS